MSALICFKLYKLPIRHFAFIDANIITGMNKARFGNRFRSKLRGIKPSASRDCSTYQFRYASLSKLEFQQQKYLDIFLIIFNCIVKPYG
jgi:hypothetical protein